MLMNRLCKTIRYSSAALLLAMFSISPVVAQYVDLGQDPASTRWRQIKTDQFQIIYPDFYEENAQYIANLYARLYQHANSLGVKAKKMSMIIRANGGISNGNAGWAPKKSELYTTPPQGPDDNWLEHLCVHEFRHVVQYDKINQGFSKLLYYLFGEHATMVVVGAYIPMWLLEGDATVFETSVGKGGRGRSPEFLNELKAQVMEKGIYHYYKAVLGSYKDYVPGRYQLGYYMVGNSRQHYGNEIWQDVFERTGRRSYGLSPVARSLRLTLKEKRDSLWDTPRFHTLFSDPESTKRKNSNRDAIRELYQDNFMELRQVWKEEARAIHHQFDTIATENRVYTNYHYPTPLGDGRLIAYKEGLAEAGVFVVLHSGEETTLFRPGMLYDYSFAYQYHMLLWSEYSPHPRWEHGGKMTLATYNLWSGAYQRFPASENRFSPFPTGKGWGFVEVDRHNRASLVLTDHTLQKEHFRLQGKFGELFVHPSLNDREEIITVVTSPEGKWIEAINIHTRERRPLTPRTDYEIDNPRPLKGEDLLYRAAFNTNNAFYKKEASSGFGEHVLEAKYGIRYPSLSSGYDTLYFSFYTSEGYKPGKVALCNTISKPVETKSFTLADTLARMEKWLSPSFGIDSVYSTRKYNKSAHLFNVHSWAPFFPDRDEVELTYGIAVSAQNKLSTFYWTAGYVWDSGYDEGCWKLKATYKGLWPTLQLELKHGRSTASNIDREATHLPSGQTDTLIIQNNALYTRVKPSLQFPFNLSSGNYNRRITPFITYERHDIHRLKPYRLFRYAGRAEDTQLWEDTPLGEHRFSNPNITLQVLQYGLRWQNYTRMSPRDLNPRWGQRLEIGYEHTPSALNTLDYGSLWWGEGTFYLPGISCHHSLYAYFGYQKQSMDMMYGRQINSPRGTSLWGKELYSLQTGYKMPLAYPDYHLRSFMYIKRINGGLFFDAGKDQKCFSSYGAEVTMDVNWFILTTPFSIGLRGGYETQTKSTFANFLLSFSLSL